MSIRVGIIGAGSMGKGLLYQTHITPGVHCAAICDLRIERCTQALEQFGIAYAVVDSPAGLGDAVRRGALAVCNSAAWLAECEGLDAIIEASSSIGAAADHCLRVMECGKHLILMNSEIDLMFGPFFHQEARRLGVVCTSCDGDQYGVLKNLIDDIRLWGLTPVMAGNIKGFLDRYATPDSIVAEADKRALDYRMCASYTDGTKLNIEMAIVANAFGMWPSQTGMHGPKAKHVTDIFDCFDFSRLWESRRPVVDYILGAEPGGGVFAVGYCDAPYQQKMLSYYKMGDGPFYLFQRPYHLCHMEALKAVFRAVERGETFMGPDAGMLTNVYAYAKRDLSAGTVLDGIGGFECYGLIEPVKTDDPIGLPIGLAEGVVLRNPVHKDGRIGMSDIVHDGGRADFELYARALAVLPRCAKAGLTA